MSTIQVSVKGASEIRRVLSKWVDPNLNRELDAAAKLSAKYYARELKSALRPVSKRMARAVRVKRARRERPGWVVGSRRKTAFFWPFVIGGTRAHGPRRAKLLAWQTPQGTVTAHRVRGVRANPIVESVATRSEARAMAEADKYLDKNV